VGTIEELIERKNNGSGPVQKTEITAEGFVTITT
jgi:hypothetical protein